MNSFRDGRIEYIINPAAGSSSTKLLVWQFREYLLEHNYDLKIRTLSNIHDVRNAATNAASDKDCSLLIVAGGDGTIREVARCVQQKELPIMILPCGTENLIASELGYDEKVSTLIKYFEEANIKTIDLGRIEDRVFTSVVGIGFDAAVVHHLHEHRKGNIDFMDYFWPLWRTFWTYDFPLIKVTVDDEQVFNDRGIAIVGNISRFGLGLEICQKADYSDGLLDICIFKCDWQLPLLKHSFMASIKKHIGSKNTHYYQAKKISVESPQKNVYYELDGDPGNSLPIDISVIPQALNIVISKDAKPAGMRTRFMRLLG
jgi:diacylglycerol kinase (ATP)